MDRGKKYQQTFKQQKKKSFLCTPLCTAIMLLFEALNKTTVTEKRTANLPQMLLCMPETDARGGKK